MGGIKVVTPKSAVQPLPPLVRMKRPTENEMAAIQTITVIPCVSSADGLKKIKVDKIDQLMSCDRELEKLSVADVVWQFSQIISNSSSIKGWNGFMTEFTKIQPFNVSRVVYLPFINEIRFFQHSVMFETDKPQRSSILISRFILKPEALWLNILTNWEMSSFI